VNKIILVADDNPIMREALSELFEAEDGLELCEQAVNGQDAVNKAKYCQPDLIILDFAMPVMNGLEAAGILRAIMPAVPIILFTVHSREMVSQAAGQVGIDAIMPKSELVHLVEHTRTLLNRAA
jgi:DNA-binding NarL/FixJ family response regulator